MKEKIIIQVCMYGTDFSSYEREEFELSFWNLKTTERTIRNFLFSFLNDTVLVLVLEPLIFR